jgi:hypothetical protein
MKRLVFHDCVPQLRSMTVFSDPIFTEPIVMLLDCAPRPCSTGKTERFNRSRVSSTEITLEQQTKGGKQ